MSDYKAAFDYSYGEAAFAVIDCNDKVLFDEYLELNNRDASRIPLWLVETLQKYEIKFDDIKEWSVGAGPGSFTGLRIASSLVMGLCFDKNVRRRSVPTASALAAAAKLPEDTKHVLALYDGRKNEILGYALDKKNGFFVSTSDTCTVISSEEQIPELRRKYDAFVALEKDRNAIIKVISEELADNVNFMRHVSATELARFMPDDFNARLSDLIYLRPAVFVEPKNIRVFS